MTNLQVGFQMTVHALRVVNGIDFSLPRLNVWLRHALARVIAARYAEQRENLARTGFGGMV